MDKVSQKSIETNQGFWIFVKPFLTNKGAIAKK